MMRYPSLPSPLPSPQTLSELVLLYLVYEVNVRRGYSAGKQLNSLIFERITMKSWKTLTIIVLDPSAVAFNYAVTRISLLIAKECGITPTGNNVFLLITLFYIAWNDELEGLLLLCEIMASSNVKLTQN